MDIKSTCLSPCLLALDAVSKPAPETTHERMIKFAEESTMFTVFYKDFSVRPMPNPSLMLLLYKFKLNKTNRKVTKKEKISRAYGHKNDKDAQRNPFDAEDY